MDLLEKTISASTYPEINTLSDNVKAAVEAGNFDEAYKLASKEKSSKNLYGIYVETDDKKGYVKVNGDVEVVKRLFSTKATIDFDVVDKSQASLYSAEDAEEIRQLLIKNGSVKNSNIQEISAASQGLNESEADIVINIFLEQLQPQALRESVINNFKQDFINTLIEYGFTTYKNDYLQFLIILFGLHNTELSGVGFRSVQKMVSDSIISTSTLRGKEKGLGEKHIIFDDNLYLNRNSVDIQFIVQTFEWFGTRWQVLNYINQGSIKTAEQKQVFNDIKLSITDNVLEMPCFKDITILRDHIIYDVETIDGHANTNSDKIRSADDIEKYLAILESSERPNFTRTTNTQTQGNSQYTATQDSDVWKKAMDSISGDIDVNNLTNSQINDLMRYVKSLSGK